MQPLPFDGKAFDALDAEMREVFPSRQLIAMRLISVAWHFPDPARCGAARIVGSALAQARGGTFVVPYEDARKVALYRGDRRSLEGRAMFVNTDESSPAAAYLTLNDPLAYSANAYRARSGRRVHRAHARGCGRTTEARRNDTRRREAAFVSAAQAVFNA